MKHRIYLLIALITAMWQCAAAEDYFQDTVWTKKTDQADGFWKVKFSNNDSLIVGHGMEMDMFYDAKTGQEIKRIPGNNEVFFINHDSNFVRLNEIQTKFEIFDTHTFQVIDSLEYDSNIVNQYPIIDMSNDGMYIVAAIPNGFRVWDVVTKTIFKTMQFPSEPNLVSAGVDNPRFVCDDSKILAQVSKTYQDPNHPGDSKYYTNYGNFIVYDLHSLDSIDSFGNHRAFVLSKTCEYIAIATGDPTFGVEIYNFLTKELFWKLPINGPSLTGIEFSPDDKYLVTSNGVGANCMKIWSMVTGEVVYDYAPGTYSNFDISNDGNYIISSTGKFLFLWYSRYEPNLIEEPIGQIQSTIYPNPSTGLTTIQFTQPASEITNINLTDLNGIQINQVFNGIIESGSQSININTSQLQSGTYFIQVHNTHISLTFKLIVNY